MKLEEAGSVLAMLTAGFHRETLEQGTIDLWIEVLEPMDAEIATEVALTWVKNQDAFPTISQFRHAYHVERRSRDPHELSATHDTPADLGLSESGLPSWVQRWMRRYKAVSVMEDPRARAAFEDWRVFPEQIVGETKYTDDPRFTRAEAEELGIMPEDAWTDAVPGR